MKRVTDEKQKCGREISKRGRYSGKRKGEIIGWDGSINEFWMGGWGVGVI